MTEGSAAEPEPTGLYQGDIAIDVAGLEASFGGIEHANGACELVAAEFASDDYCSLMCDPAALADRMRSDGLHGQCFQLLCERDDADPVLVGACIP